MGERGDFESWENKQLMSSCFVFELDKIRKKTHEGSILTYEQVIFPDKPQSLGDKMLASTQKKATPNGMAFFLKFNGLTQSHPRPTRPYFVRRLLKSRTLGVAMKMEL